ncbi:DUF5313 family protein [Williamsia sterculiae]|uniref:DUF5313 domain-containing protein n=1 Tax=Williamsia sterculiae TaxID=1344003 RepID=A0A1N7FHI7_9NOCA|nr:DUF5313 family protein [Williamsia sterculiae]SIR99744.1 hypothetical protein SAMN05445060_2072 [Williamsia sterculiae]
MSARRRPTPVQWVLYCFGRPLPVDLRDWVRNDLTGPHALSRHLIRGMVPFVPIFVIFLLLPGAIWLRLAMTALGLILALIYSAAYMVQNRARRLHQHGLDPAIEPVRVARERERAKRSYEAIYGRSRTVTGQHRNSLPKK